MTELVAEYLEFDAELLAAKDDDAPREAEGLALPYGQIINRMHLATGARRQVWAPGSVKPREDAKFYYGHDHVLGGMPIGRVVKTKDQDTGSRWRVRFANTAKAAEVHALMKPDKDGKAVIDKFSVGYHEVDGYLDTTGEYEGTETDPVWVHTNSDAIEVSAVPIPALSRADIDSVLSEAGNRGPKVHDKEEAPMTETLEAPVSKEDFDALSEKFEVLTGSIDGLERRIATVAHIGGGDPTGPVVPGRSRGEFVKLLASGDKDAMKFLEHLQESVTQGDYPGLLAFEGTEISDVSDYVKPAWVGDRYKAITESRRLHQLFDSRPLPKEGMSIEYGKVAPETDTTDVTEQAAEGDTLAYGKIGFGTDTAPVKTYGGWGDMSRQVIQRSGVNVVEKFFQLLDLKYARTTEAALRTAVANVANSHALAGTGVDDLTTPDGWTDFVIDAAFWLEDKGLQPEFILVGRDKFKSLALMRQDGSDGAYFMDRTKNTVNIVGLSGELFTLPVIPVNSNGLVRVGHSSAICTYEDGLAPFRMQDSDITNLTDAFSEYGYEAIAVEDKDALVSPDVTA